MIFAAGIRNEPDFEWNKQPLAYGSCRTTPEDIAKRIDGVLEKMLVEAA